MNIDKKQLTGFLEQCVDKNRFAHSLNTAAEAVRLAQKYGADEQKAYVAGLLHDIAKGKCADGLKKLAAACGIPIDAYEDRNPELLHGKIGAAMVCSQLGICDEEILSAIRWHTTGQANMSLLDKIVYLADLIEPGRKFEGVGPIRELAYQDIDAAIIRSLEQVMRFVQSQGFALHPKSVEAYQYLKELEEKKKFEV